MLWGSHAAGRLLPEGPGAWTAAGLRGIRGVTVGPVESPGVAHRGYGSPQSAALLDELLRLGAGWVAVTPFARLWSLRSTEIELGFEQPFERNRQAVLRFVRQAKARGLRVLLVPHLWVDTGGWRGELDPGSPERWRKLQRAYRRFVLAWAEVAAEAGADMLSLGVECKSWSDRFPEFWYGLVAAVRARFGGLLTYSANWDEVEQVLFWDRLDVVGINAFYPLADAPGAPEAELHRRAQQVAASLRDVAEREARPVLFVEVGFASRPGAEVAPWTWPEQAGAVRVDERSQARALRAVLQAMLPEPWFAGFFVWRYYADPDDVTQEPDWGFSPRGKQAERLLREAFARRWGVDPPAWPWWTPPWPSPLPPIAPYPFAGLLGFPGPVRPL